MRTNSVRPQTPNGPFAHDHAVATTMAVLLIIGNVQPYTLQLIQLSRDPRFLMAMQSYLGHPDPSIRRLGMLVAEVVSERTVKEDPAAADLSYQDEVDELKAGLEVDGDDPKPKKQRRNAKRLRFGASMWEGDGDGREEARWLRSIVGSENDQAELKDDPSGAGWLLGWDERDIDLDELPKSRAAAVAETKAPRTLKSGKNTATGSQQGTYQPKIVMLNDEQRDDPLEGYHDASPSSSRSPSPDQAHLDEVAADPSLALDAAGKKKIQRPVYVSQLIALLKERESPDHLEVALRHGESLIRAKRSFGTELGGLIDTNASLDVLTIIAEDNATKVAQLIVGLK